MARLLVRQTAAIPAFDLVEAGAATAGCRPTSCSRSRASHPDLYDAPAASPRRGERRRPARAARDARRDGRRLGRFVGAASRQHSKACSRQRAAGRAAGPSGRHARGRPAGGIRSCTPRLEADLRPAAQTTTVRAPSRRRRSPSTSRACDVELEPGWRAEINLRAVEWVREAARPAAARVRRPDRLRPRGARAVFRRRMRRAR